MPGQPPSLAPDAANRLVALATEKRYPEMETLSAELATAYPQAGFVWKALSVARQLQGKDALKALETAARLLPHDPEAHSNLGAALRQQGRAQDAISCYRHALDLRPDVPEVWNNLGHALHDCGRFDDAVAAFRRALALRPGLVKSLNNLGNALKDSGRLEDAVESYQGALRADPRCLEAHVNLGNIRRLQSHSADAERSCRVALELEPQFVPAILLQADLQADQGHFAEAENSYRRAAALQPDSPEAWAGIAGLKRMSAADSDWVAEARRMLAAGLPPRREIPLRYAVGKYHDDVGDHGEAFANYQCANALAKSIRPRHDRGQVTEGVDRIIGWYDADWLDQTRAAAPAAAASADVGRAQAQTAAADAHRSTNGHADAEASERAVFIVGMPRSGTTLAEQIMASHCRVFGGGELSFWNTAVTRHAAAGAVALPALQLKTLAHEYLAGLTALSTDAARVVDKMPGNFLYLGLIHAALPKARFIHLRRNALDTCLSIYFQHFGAVHSYADDLGDLAHYYREYLRIMDHWRRILPPHALLEVDYEDLVTATETTSRTMIDFIGLPWDANCLEFHRNPRTVSTFSKWQARQTVNAGSVERWRRYERFIAPLRTLG